MSGDRIRFHVQSNVDGYAYIFLISGSQGSRSILYPYPEQPQDNTIKRGQQYVLPGNGNLAFDSHPGIEKVTLLISKRPLDASNYLAKHSKRAVIVSDAHGSKDIGAPETVIAYGHASRSRSGGKSGSGYAKYLALEPESALVPEDTTKVPAVQPGNARKKIAGGVLAATEHAATGSSDFTAPDNVVTLVYKGADNILSFDVDLKHK